MLALTDMQKIIHKALIFGICLSIISSVALSAAESDVLGVWWTPEKKSKLQIESKDGVFSGQIIAVRKERGVRKDEKNPDEKLRDRNIIGLEIMSNLKFDGKSEWNGGTIYDPEKGKTYKMKITIKDENTLRVRGFIGVALFGRSEEFVRVIGEKPSEAQAGEPEMIYLKDIK